MRKLVAEHAEETGVSIAALRRTVGLSRATFYRASKSQVRPKEPEQPEQTETTLRDALQQVALECPAYGYRRITAQLAREGWQVNQVTRACLHKRVLRLMRQDNLRVQARLRFACGSGGSCEPRTPNMACTSTRILPPNLW